MAIKMQNKIDTTFSATSMSDLVFLLLIFFMLTSTMVSPNAINLVLPKSTADKQLVTKDVEVYINEDLLYFVNPEGSNAQPTPYEELLPALQNAILQDNSDNHSIILRADKSVPVENVVALMDVLNELNEGFPEEQRYKMVLATEAK
ncbi:MAG: biopolymer transporter ExbD [Bacteroidales bacterium]|jgi:biopolymer transport protein ExbD|nr:biopolymer transporter ExbD [Bacteroidales bacterium]MBR6333779.1 biopolymer transporter ExbD [Bacteroidales bacterium]